MIRSIIAMAAAATAVSAQGHFFDAGHYGAGTCSGTAANPSVYNYQIGDYPAKVISDGVFTLPGPEAAFAVDPSLVTRAREKNFLPTDVISLEISVTYVEWGVDRILFDTGAGFVNNVTAGWLYNQLDTEGIERDSITKILITHGHGDHIGGLIEGPDSGPAFPNADIYISQEEIDFWADPFFENDGEDASNQGASELFNTVYDKVKDKVKTFPAGNGEVIPGITTSLCPYHTPGHVAYTLTPPEGAPLVIGGDCIIEESVSINNQFELKFDTIQADGPAGRVKLLDQLAADRVKAMLYHAAFPGLGYIVPNDLTFDFKPASYEKSEAVKTMCPV